MAVIPLATTVRNLNRLQQIARVLARHGFGHIVDRMNLGRFLPAGKLFRRARGEAEAASIPLGKRLAEVAVELGPTFVKLGQTLSTRPDVLPEEIIRELRTLQDQVPPFEHAQALCIIAEDTGAAIPSSFATFADAPLACGSIGQVYHARTTAGIDVVVKVKRPGIDDIVRQDLALMKWLANAAEQWVPELARFHPVHIVEEFELVLLRELDFIAEASATARFEEAFRGDDAVHIPHVLWELTSPRVLTLGRVGGQNLETIDLEGHPPIDRHLLARRLVNIYLKQFFDLRMYHADPHPGNILITPPARIGLIDFGQVGTLSDETANDLVIMLLGLIYREPGVVVEVLSDLGAVEPGVDTRMLARALRQMLDKYHGLPLDRLDLPGIFNELARVIRDYGVTLPRETVMVIKTLVNIAGVALKLDPELDLVALLSPRIKGLIAKQFEPQRLVRSAGVSLWHLFSMVKSAPAQLRSSFRRLGSGKWQLHVRHENIDRLTNELDRSSNRMSFAVVIAGVIIGSSLLVSSNTQFAPLHIPVQWIGVVGYAFAGVLGVGLLWAIWRSGRLS